MFIPMEGIDMVNMDRITDTEKEIAKKIGDFYYDIEAKKTDDPYKASNEACKSIQMMGIKDIGIVDEQIVIRLSRPGLLIGEKGLNLDSLVSHLSEGKDKRVKIKIVESRLDEFLYPYIYDEDDL
jgi:hypothetical protein